MVAVAMTRSRQLGRREPSICQNGGWAQQQLDAGLGGPAWRRILARCVAPTAPSRENSGQSRPTPAALVGTILERERGKFGFARMARLVWKGRGSA